MPEFCGSSTRVVGISATKKWNKCYKSKSGIGATKSGISATTEKRWNKCHKDVLQFLFHFEALRTISESLRHVTGSRDYVETVNASKGGDIQM